MTVYHSVQLIIGGGRLEVLLLKKVRPPHVMLDASQRDQRFDEY